MHRHLPLYLLCPLVLMLPTATPAQMVRGEVVDAETAVPLDGTIVVLLYADGLEALNTITSAEGRFSLRAPALGKYQLRVDRIGYESVTSAAFEITAGTDVYRRLEVAAVAIRLDGIVIASNRQCVIRPDANALETARVWEQARIALTAAVETQRQQLLRFDTEIYVRELDPRTLRIGAEQRSVRRGGFLLPFGTRDPQDLFENGFVQSVDGGMYYDFFAPTAEVLLSDAFLDTHCFRLASGTGDDAGLIGLEFEPVRRRRVPDVEGTLWLDPATSALRHVEMRYVASDARVPVDGALARVEFQALPGGRWIVGRWFIRMPVITEQQVSGGFSRSRPARSIASFRQEGGEVTRITTADGQPVSALERIAVSGTVYDSLAGRPLARARVVLEGTSYRAVADDAGRFAFGGVPPGRYRVRVEHARLDSLPRAAVPTAEIEVEDGEPVEIDLALPWLQTLIEATCPGLWDQRPELPVPGAMYRLTGNSVLTGIVRDTAGLPVPGATAFVSWGAFRLAERRVQVRDIVPSTTTDADGRFTICGVPSDTQLSVWATHGDVTGPEITVRVAGRFAYAGPVVGATR